MFEVQWFPGHMTRAFRKIKEEIKNIDLVIEIRDSRLPFSSSNPEVDKLSMGKERFIILNKKDLSNPNMSNKWIEYFKGQYGDHNVVLVDSLNPKDIKLITKELMYLRTKIFEKRVNKGINLRPLRCIVMGISNVGKSTFINSFVNKKVAQTGDRPGVTKGNQWIKINKEIELLDSPGVLWPKFETEDVALNLACTGAINDLIFNNHEAALLLIHKLKLGSKEGIFEEEQEYLETYIRKRGLLFKGGGLDYDTGSLLFLKDFRKGKFGKFTLEAPSDLK